MAFLPILTAETKSGRLLMRRPCKRTKENTEAFTIDLAKRVNLPDPALTDADDLPQISTDGWAAYPHAVDMAFADGASHGVIIKKLRRRC